jgi:hypothetical protein
VASVAPAVQGRSCRLACAAVPNARCAPPSGTPPGGIVEATAPRQGLARRPREAPRTRRGRGRRVRCPAAARPPEATDRRRRR